MNMADIKLDTLYKVNTEHTVMYDNHLVVLKRGTEVMVYMKDASKVYGLLITERTPKGISYTRIHLSPSVLSPAK